MASLSAPDLDDLALMQIHCETLFRLDDQQRLAFEGAPRFFLGRTNAGHVWRFHQDLPDLLLHKLDELCRDEPVGEELAPLPKHHDRYIELLRAERDVTKIWSGPAWWFKGSWPASPGIVEITEQNSALLNSGLEEWLVDVQMKRPLVASIDDGKAVSVCCSSTQGAKAHEAGLETLADYQSRGHALKAVMGWADLVASLGVMPLYSTSWKNKASQAVAAKLGLALYGVDFHIT